jgi:hypothetical protein
LSLDLSGSQVSDLTPLLNLSKLTHLTLNLSKGFGDLSSQVSDLAVLSNLARLQTLSIRGAIRAQRRSLRNIPASLVDLKF